MKRIINKTVWVIMDKERNWLAKGTPRNRELCRLDKPDNKRVLTYSTKKRAESGFKHNGFYCESEMVKDYGVEYVYSVDREKINPTQYLEAVECKLSLEVKP